MCKEQHRIFKEACDSCQALRSEWLEYVKAAGFIDIENQAGDIIDHATNIQSYHFKTEVQAKAKESYYSWARAKLQEGAFQSQKERIVWEYHAEGWSRRSIAKAIGNKPSWDGRLINKIKDYLTTQPLTLGSLSVTHSVG